VAVIPLEITVLAKSGGPLTKRIYLEGDRVAVDASVCMMGRGSARRVRLTDVYGLAKLIGNLAPHEAIALGALRPDLPDGCEVITKVNLEKLNCAARPNIIARTSMFIGYRPDQPALVLLDHDTKGMPAAVSMKLTEIGGFWQAVVSIVPALQTIPHVIRHSTSAGLYRGDTGTKLPGSNGQHVYLVVSDGSDAERFLKALHARCWLAGFGWLMVSAGGQLLERSIVDRMVGAPERLIFEGAPVLEFPLAQDQESRRPIATEGHVLDTVAICPPLSIVEQATFRELRAKEVTRLAPEAAKAKAEFIARQTRHLAEKTGLEASRAHRIVERQCSGVLLPHIVLPFDDPEFVDCTVADVLADPDRFEGATLADPLEGVEYGICKARVMRRTDGTPWVHSFAHGRTVYELRFDAHAAKAALEKTSKEEAADTFIRLVLAGDLDADELERLRDLASNRSGVGRRVLDSKLKRVCQEQAERQAQENRERRIAQRRDPRLQIPAPTADAPWLPHMEVLNDVLGKSRDPEPPMRDVEGFVVQVRVRRVPKMHLLTAYGSNQCDTDETRLPAPEQPLLTRLDEIRLAELIERHIEYVDAETGRPVHLASPFVKHYLTRADDALPVATGIATVPIVLPNGTLLSGRGLDRDRGIVFRVPPELEAILPKPAECTPAAVAKAMQYLTHEWLCDLASDYTGRCTVIACALTILERLLLSERPAFFVTAGQRGGGKTTTVNMISLAVLGLRAAAAAWSPSEEERRKSLFSYLREGVPLLPWDNLPRGAAISCPSIEKSLTAETYSDRILGVSETGTASAFTIQIFTGNNITPRGDLASRSLPLRLAVDRRDPENRPFAHPDPIAWTEANRGRILQALYTILLGNPRLRDRNPGQAPTRFKMWWHLVGSAVEYAAGQHVQIAEEEVRCFIADPNTTCPPGPIRFAELFLAGEADEEQSAGLATVLDVLRRKWPNGFKSVDVASYAGGAEEGAIAFGAALELASGKRLKTISSSSITWRLKGLVDAPVIVGGITLVLRRAADHEGAEFTVREIR
jgi:hypothetical protein